METYRNAFTQQEDRMLWELHEIRHELHHVLRQKTVEEINTNAFEKYQAWQNDAAKKPMTSDDSNRMS
jgi:hypothetical protein